MLLLQVAKYYQGSQPDIPHNNWVVFLKIKNRTSEQDFELHLWHVSYGCCCCPSCTSLEIHLLCKFYPNSNVTHFAIEFSEWGNWNLCIQRAGNSTNSADFLSTWIRWSPLLGYCCMLSFSTSLVDRNPRHALTITCRLAVLLNPAGWADRVI